MTARAPKPASAPARAREMHPRSPRRISLSQGSPRFVGGVGRSSSCHLWCGRLNLTATTTVRTRKTLPELLLYDPNGNLVAIANGNGANGSDSVIDFTIPDGDGGAWTAQVTGSGSP